MDPNTFAIFSMIGLAILILAIAIPPMLWTMITKPIFKKSIRNLSKPTSRRKA